MLNSEKAMFAMNDIDDLYQTAVNKNVLSSECRDFKNLKHGIQHEPEEKQNTVAQQYFFHKPHDQTDQEAEYQCPQAY